MRDTSTLALLYDACGGAKWLNNTGWDLSRDPCSSPRHGVSCSSGRVTQINLQKNGLRGTLPTQIGELTEMVHFELDMNAVSGTIPTQLGKLAKLCS